MWAYPGTAQIFGVAAIISEMGKATKFKFCTHIYRIDRNKSSLKFGKVAVGVLRDSGKFSGYPCIGRIARSSLRQLSFLVSRRRCGCDQNHL